MWVADLMTPDPMTVLPGVPIREAARRLADRKITAAPVVDGASRLVGVVSEADLLIDEVLPDPRAHARPVTCRQAPSARRVGDVMTTRVVAVGPHTDAADAVRLMLDNGVKSLPVLDGTNVIGMISRSDVLRTLTPDDKVIEQGIWARLAEYSADLVPWTVRVSDGIATVGGKADAEQQRIAVLLAATVPGVVTVLEQFTA